MPASAPDSTAKIHEIGHMRDVQRALKCGRSTIYNLMKNDPDFPAPREIAGKLSWFVDEVEEYKSTRPRRQNHSTNEP